jgi:hypothetical protein
MANSTQYRQYNLGLGKNGMVFKVIHEDLNLGLVSLLYSNGVKKTVTKEYINLNSNSSDYYVELYQKEFLENQLSN